MRDCEDRAIREFATREVSASKRCYRKRRDLLPDCLADELIGGVVDTEDNEVSTDPGYLGLEGIPSSCLGIRHQNCCALERRKTTHLIHE